MPNVLAYTCNPSTWEVDKGQSGGVQGQYIVNLKPAWAI